MKDILARLRFLENFVKTTSGNVYGAAKRIQIWFKNTDWILVTWDMLALQDLEEITLLKDVIRWDGLKLLTELKVVVDYGPKNGRDEGVATPLQVSVSAGPHLYESIKNNNIFVDFTTTWDKVPDSGQVRLTRRNPRKGSNLVLIRSTHVQTRKRTREDMEKFTDSHEAGLLKQIDEQGYAVCGPRASSFISSCDWIQSVDFDVVAECANTGELAVLRLCYSCGRTEHMVKVAWEDLDAWVSTYIVTKVDATGNTSFNWSELLDMFVLVDPSSKRHKQLPEQDRQVDQQAETQPAPEGQE